MTWMFELYDRFSGPADRIAKSLDRVEKAVAPAKLTGLAGAIDGIGATFGAKAAAFAASLSTRFPMIGKAIGMMFDGKGVIDGVRSFAAKIQEAFPSLSKVIGSVASFLGERIKAIPGSIKGAFKMAATGVGVAIAGFTALLVGGGALALAGGKIALDALSFKENTLIAFKTMLRSDEEAAKVYAQATKFAAKTPFSTEEVVSGFQKFLTAGFKTDQLEKLMLAAGDVGAAMGVDKMNSVITAMTQIQAKGKLSGEELMQLAEAGVGQTQVFEALSKTLGKTTAEVQKLISSGKVTGEQGVTAVMAAIESSISGGKLGSLMDAQSKTISGLLSTLKDVPSTFFNAMNSDFMGGAKDFLSTLTKALDPDSAVGKRILGIFNMVGSVMGDVFGQLPKGDGVAGMLHKILNAAEPLARALASFGAGMMKGIGGVLGGIIDKFSSSTPEDIKATAVAFERFGKLIGWIIGGLIVVVGALVGIGMMFQRAISSAIDFGESIVASVDNLWNKLQTMSLYDIGTYLIQGLIDGFLQPTMIDTAITGVADRLLNGLAAAFGIASPSTKTFEIGNFLGLGLIGGWGNSGAPQLLNGMGIASNPSGLAPAGGGAPGGAKGAAGGIVVNFAPGSIVVNIDGASAKDTNAIGAAVGGSVQQHVVGALSRLGIEVGG